MIECLVHYMEEVRSKESFKVIPDFFQIDPLGAGKYGIDHWLEFAKFNRESFDE